jgi:hypothetical protein
MKKLISIITIIMIITSIFPVSVFGSDIPNNDIDIFVNGKLIEKYHDNMRPFIDNNSRTQVPLRTLAEAMGFEVVYENKTKTITIPTNGGNVVLQIGSNKVQTPDGTISMDTAAVIINGRTYVPIRFVSEALGWTVGYKQNRDNSGKSASRATHIITVDKITESGTTTTKEENGIMVQGVRKYEYNMDLRNNEYLNELAEQYGKGYFNIGMWGAAYSRSGRLSEESSFGATVALGGDPHGYGYWTIEVLSFNKGEDRPVLLSLLKVITGDAEAIFNAFEKMWEDPISLEEGKVKYRFGQWQTIGQTNYMFDTTLSGIALLKIKY